MKSDPQDWWVQKFELLLVFHKMRAPIVLPSLQSQWKQTWKKFAANVAIVNFYDERWSYPMLLLKIAEGVACS